MERIGILMLVAFIEAFIFLIFLEYHAWIEIVIGQLIFLGCLLFFTVAVLLIVGGPYDGIISVADKIIRDRKNEKH